MKQLFFIASVLTIVLVTGCGHKPEAQSTTPAGTTPIDVSQLSQGTSTPSAPTASQPQQVTETKTTSVPVNIKPQPTSTATGAVGLNPAHGQPGHRCDISVGAPLNSAPTTNTTPTINTAPTITQQPATISSPTVISSAPSTTPTAPGMNPPHGQPGHRCDIAVGSPLNSAPTKPTNNNIPTISTVPVVPVVTTPPAKKDSN